ncbi:MAG: hypothetical protein JO303_06755 [Caulobacteraceae bacterium]|nr:hypothetical protein [Caulobacteraceae bacterium]
MRIMTAGALALLMVVGCQRGAPQAAADRCAAPPDWRAAYAKPGQPQAELTACLKFQAYQTRKLAIPLSSAANGIIAMCEVDVDRFEGALVTDNAMAPDAERLAAEQNAMRQASAAVTQYKACP